MSGPFVVSLRVNLAYDAANCVKSAVSDIEAVRSAAQQPSVQRGSARSTLNFDNLVRRTAVAKAGTADPARVGTCLACSANSEVRRMQARALQSVRRVA